MAEITSLRISNLPNKVSYKAGDRFERYGMEVKARYSDQSEATIPFYDVSPNRELRASDTSIRVSFMGFSATQGIDVADVGDGGYFPDVCLRGAELDGNPCINAGDASVRYRCRPIKVGRDAYEISLTLIHFSRMTDRESDLIQGLPKGWRTNFHRLLVQDGQDESGNPIYKYIDDEGYVHTFEFNSELGCHLDRNGCGLELNSLSRVISDRDGNFMSFDAQGRIVSISETNGKNIVIEYNENGLRKVYDSRKPGDYIKLSYDGMSLLRWIRVYKNGAERKIYDIIGTAGQITSIRESANGSSRELHTFSVNDRDRVNRMVDRLTGEAYRITYAFDEWLNDYIFSSVRKGRMDDGSFVENEHDAIIRLAHYRNGSDLKLITELFLSFGNNLEAMYDVDSCGNLVSSFESIGSGRELRSLEPLNGNPVGHNGLARIIVNGSVADSFFGTLYVNGGLRADEFGGEIKLRICGYAKIQAGCERVRLSFSHLNSTSKRIDLNPHAEEVWQYFQVPFSREIGQDGAPLDFDNFSISATDELGNDILMTIADLRFMKPKDDPTAVFEIANTSLRLDDLASVELVNSDESVRVIDVAESEITFTAADLVSALKGKARSVRLPIRIYFNGGKRVVPTYGRATLVFSHGERINVLDPSELDNSIIGNGRNWYLTNGDMLDSRAYFHFGSGDWSVTQITTRLPVGDGQPERLLNKKTYDYCNNVVTEQNDDGSTFNYEYFSDGTILKKTAVSSGGQEITVYQESRVANSRTITKDGVVTTITYCDDLLEETTLPGGSGQAKTVFSYDDYAEDVSAVSFVDGTRILAENSMTKNQSGLVTDLNDGYTFYRIEKSEDESNEIVSVKTRGEYSTVFEYTKRGSFHINDFYHNLPGCYVKEIIESRDQYGKVQSVYEDNILKAALAYEPGRESQMADKLCFVTDSFSERRVEIAYNEDGELSSIEEGGVSINYGNRPGKHSASYAFAAGDTFFHDDNGSSSILTSNDIVIFKTELSRDEFGRPNGKSFRTNDSTIQENYFYEQGSYSRPNGYGCGNVGESYSYYPGTGRLATKNSYFDSFMLSKAFYYDAFGRLVGEESGSGSSRQNKTYHYSGGKISRFGDDDVEYDDMGRMVGLGDMSFEYDDCGNMLSKNTLYRSLSYSYERGHLLSSVNNVASFKYDYKGRRTHKTLRNGNTHTYHYDGDALIGEDVTSDNTPASVMRIRYFHDFAGIVGFCVFGLDGSQTRRDFLYVKNPFNEIIGIAEGGELVAVYDYDAWGNHKVLNPDGTENDFAGFIGNINPIRYKSYYYDVETGLYSLNSRYYDPEIAHFLTLDDFNYISPTSISGMDLLVYCNYDPVNHYDPNGHFGIWAIIGIVVGLVAVAATANDIYQIASGNVKTVVDKDSGKANVHVENSYKVLTPWMQIGYSFYLNHINPETKDVIKGSSFGVETEWMLHNIAYYFATAFGATEYSEPAKSVDVGKTIFSDRGHGLLSTGMHLYYLIKHPIIGILELIFVGE